MVYARLEPRRIVREREGGGGGERARASSWEKAGQRVRARSGPGSRRCRPCPGGPMRKTNRAALASEKGVRPAGAGPIRPVGKREQVAPA